MHLCSTVSSCLWYHTSRCNPLSVERRKRTAQVKWVNQKVQSVKRVLKKSFQPRYNLRGRNPANTFVKTSMAKVDTAIQANLSQEANWELLHELPCNIFQPRHHKNNTLGWERLECQTVNEAAILWPETEQTCWLSWSLVFSSRQEKV